METRLLTIETPASFQDALAEACRVLREGHLVAVPTETVYGLAANALDSEAVARIYETKGRPAANPIIVHVDSLAMARQCVAIWPPAAEALASRFWPGPLTLVLPKADTIPQIITAGGTTVGIRWPSHPFMRELIRKYGFPLAAPSANPANQISPTTAAHVQTGLTGKIPLIIDAGPSPVGIESTVVDLSGGQPRILRPGMISREQLASVVDLAPAGGGEPSVGALKSPGQLQKHYSPRAKVMVAGWKDEANLERIVRATALPPSAVHVLAYDKIPRLTELGRVAVIPEDPEAYARALYSEFHISDELGARLILVEELPASSAWEGIRDRLRRASA